MSSYFNEMLVDIKNFMLHNHNHIFVIVGENASGKSCLADVLKQDDMFVVLDNFCYKDYDKWESLMEEFDASKKYIIVTHDYDFCKSVLESIGDSSFEYGDDLCYIVMFTPKSRAVTDLYLPIEFPGYGWIDSVRDIISKGFDRYRCFSTFEHMSYDSDYIKSRREV